MHNYFLGIDGGATKTAAIIIDASGREHGRGVDGAGNIAQSSVTELEISVRGAVRKACESAGLSGGLAGTGFGGVCAGMAGYSAVERRLEFAALLRVAVPALSYRVEPDYVTAYWGATGGAPGIVVIAGTGAVAYGCNACGEASLEDGLGFLLGDRGSGFDLGLAALRHVLDQVEAGQLDTLTETVLACIGAQNREGVLQWLYKDVRAARVAALAPAVGALAEAGDRTARSHVSNLARRLRNSVRRLRIRLRMGGEVPVFPLGGLWNLGVFFRSEFEQPRWQDPNSETAPDALSDEYFTIGVPQHDATYGAALLASLKVEGRG